MSDKENNYTKKAYSRRKFLRDSGFTVGGVAIGSLFGGLLIDSKGEVPTEEVMEHHPDKALMYLTLEEFRTVEAAVERIFPKDELGPGAKALGVAYFIDHQLASPWGNNAREYMQGPFHPGEPTQGYQGRQTNTQIFMIGLKALQSYSESLHNGFFESLTEEQQDGILVDFENLEGENKVEVAGISSAQFFAMLQTLTMEGVYSDPMYGGNNNMGGWKMKNFPGHQMSYLDVIEEKEFVEKTPQSLSSMHHH